MVHAIPPTSDRPNGTSLAKDGRKHVADRAPHDDVGQSIHLRWRAVHDDHISTEGLGDGHHIGDRVHRQRRTDSQQQVAVSGRGLRPGEIGDNKALPEADRTGFQDPATVETSRVVLPGIDAIQCVFHRGPKRATEADDLADRTVDLDDSIRIGAGLMVQTIDVLRNQQAELRQCLEPKERSVADVRLGIPYGRGSPTLPCSAPDVWVLDVVLKRRHLLGTRVLGPDALRAPEVGDLGVCGDTSTSQHNDTVGSSDPLRGLLEHSVVQDSVVQHSTIRHSVGVDGRAGPRLIGVAHRLNTSQLASEAMSHAPEPKDSVRRVLTTMHLIGPATSAKHTAQRMIDNGRSAVANRGARPDSTPPIGQDDILVDFWNQSSSNWYYDILTVAAIRRIMQPGDMAIDIGAHTGDVLEHIVAAAPAVRHLAVEPLPHLATDLRINFPSVQVREAALVETPAGSLQFHHVQTNPGYSGIRQRSFDRPNEEVELIDVDTARLDDIVDVDEHPVLIKLDVEGAELGVLRGATRILSNDRPVVIFEHGLGAANHYDTTPRVVHDLFMTHGYELFLLGTWLESGPPLSREQFVEQFEQQRNYYFLAAHPD